MVHQPDPHRERETDRRTLPADRPGQRPPGVGDRPPGQRPPGVGDRPPGQRPPGVGDRHPGSAAWRWRPTARQRHQDKGHPDKGLQDTGRPPGYRPPGHYPGQRPPGYVRPPGYRPPGARPPGYRPPGYRPPYPGHLPAYGGGYWGRYPNYRYPWGSYNRNWWGYATAGALTGWMVGGLNQQPVYYDYGTNLYYEGDNVYYDGQVVSTADEYAQQAQEIASNVPEVDPEKVEWLPLGVFALTENEGSVEDSTMFLQLAISKEGIIAGTFQNTATDKSFEVEGAIDNKSQRAAWGPVGESWPIMETGIYNLTENEAGALLHFEDGQTQQWTMARLDEPKDSSQN